MANVLLPLGVCLAVAVACSASPAPKPPAPLSPPVASTPTPLASASTSAPPVKPRFTTCGALDCRLYDDVATAVQDILDDEKPLVVGFGESHARKDKGAFPSSAQRFTNELVPVFKGRASNLSLELMSAPSGCEKATKTVKKDLAEVGKNQKVNDADEYVTLGLTARDAGITVTQLAPSCAEFAALTKSKSVNLDLMLLIKKLTVKEIGAILASPKHPADKLVLVYGGAYHTEPDAPEERADFSFASDVAKLVDGRYASIHLFVREFVDATWNDWPWYASFDPKAHPDKVTVFHGKPKHWVILTSASTPAGKAP